MTIPTLLGLARRSLGEARWSPYPSWRERFEVFRVLCCLRYKANTADRRSEPASQQIFGFTVTASSYRELLYLFREIFLRFEYRVAFKSSSPRILDCGANIGMSILFFKKYYPDSQVLAFEPNPTTFRFLEANVRANNLPGVEVVNAGLSLRDGEIDFYIDEHNSLTSSIEQGRGGSTVTTVRSTRLSQYLEDRRFDFAKIDIEGAEWQVVQDLRATDTIRHVDQYVFEYHHNIADSTCHLSDFLRTFEESGFGYNIKTSYETLRGFQDMMIHFYKTTLERPEVAHAIRTTATASSGAA